jgi:hypothetical protein
VADLVRSSEMGMGVDDVVVASLVVTRQQQVGMTVVVVMTAAAVTVVVMLQGYWLALHGEPHAEPSGQQSPVVVSVELTTQLVRMLVLFPDM